MKPKKVFGYNEHMTYLGSDLESIDECIAPLVQVLNDYGIKTISACCTHGKANYISIWIDPEHIKFSPVGYTSLLEKLLLWVGKKLLFRLGRKRRIEVALIAPYNYCKKDYQYLVMDRTPEIRKKWDKQRTGARKKRALWEENTEQGKKYLKWLRAYDSNSLFHRLRRKARRII